MNMQLFHSDCPFHQSGTTCTQKIRLFQALPEKVQEELMKQAVELERPKGYVFASDGDPVSSIIIIRKGKIRTYRLDTSGNEYLLDILHETQAIWHDMFLRDAVYHYSIEAVTDVSVCEISREIFLSVLNRYPEAALSLICTLSTELTDAKEKILLLSIRSPEKRTAGFLIEQIRKGNDAAVHLRLEDIASSIRLRPETISRILRKFEKEKIIQRNGKGKITVTDHKKLLSIYHDSDET